MLQRTSGKGVDERSISPIIDDLQERVLPSCWYAWKGPLGRVAAAFLLLGALPVIAVLVVLVRLESGGPGIYRQRRVGKHGRVFWLYKIRTMRRDAEARTGPIWATQDDPRVTRLGRWFRKLHLDEFPQLLNVLRGEMTLIGPRPERPEFIELLSDEVPGYLDRLAVPPGITGLAQINLPPDSDFESVRRKLVLDREYIEHASPALDLRILACTVCRVIGIPGAVAMRLFLLQRQVEPDDAALEDTVELVGIGSDTTVMATVSEQPSDGNGRSYGGRNGDRHRPRGRHCAETIAATVNSPVSS